MRQALAGIRVRAKGLATLNRAERSEVLKRRILTPARRAVGTSRQKLFDFKQKWLGLTRGDASVDHRFFSAKPRFRQPETIIARLTTLSDNPERLRAFASAALYAAADPISVMLLAGHPLSRAAMGEALAEERTSPSAAINKRITDSAQYAAGFVAATALTGDDAALEHLRGRLPSSLSYRYQEILDSYGMTPSARADAQLRGMPASGLRTHKRHRLIIAENLSQEQDFLPLLVGADHVTLIGLNDTFGKSQLPAYADLPGVGEITVEHIRSRITRFSENYIALHLKTRDLVRQLAGIMDGAPDLAPRDERPFLELALADMLFFLALKPAAISRLLDDTAFDHILIVTQDHTKGSSYLMTLASVPELMQDPRVEIVSASPSVECRTSTSRVLEQLTTEPAIPNVLEGWLPDASTLTAPLMKVATTIAEGMPLPAATTRKRVLMLTRANTAYDRASAQYALSLAKDHQVGIHFLGRNAVNLHNAMYNADAELAREIAVDILPDRYNIGVPAMEKWLVGRINLMMTGEDIDPMLRSVILINAKRLAGEIFYTYTLHARAVDAYFERLKQADALPDLIVQSPGRPPLIARYAVLARRHGIPSLSLEAHALDCRYSRYNKQFTDYYGVISTFFRDQAAGFGMTPDRTFVLGSPRIIRPEGHDLPTARTEARAAIAEEFGHDFNAFAATITFFGQPSAWDMVARVWRNTIEAARRNNIAILLKPHPEESPSRVQDYMSIVTQMGAEGFVRLVSGPPEPIICACDMLLTGYSAAAIDAAVLGVPVVLVIDGDFEYPLPQHLIIGTVLTRSTDELSDQLADFLRNPSAWQDRTDAFLQREPQFVTGHDKPLRDRAAEIMAKPRSESIRELSDLPETTFLDEPHPTFPV